MLISVLLKYRPIDTHRNRLGFAPFFIVLLLLLGTGVPAIARSTAEAIFTDNFFVPGWKVDGATYHYCPQNLYEYINGGAYFFIGYGFVELTGANVSPVTGENDAVAIDIYDMADKLNAFGVFQLRKDSQAPSLKIGTNSFGSHDYLVFHKDRFYVEIRAFFSDSKDYSTLENIALFIAKQLPGDNSLPKVLVYLPLKDRVAGSERFIKGGILGHEFLDKGLVCDYRIKGNTITAFIAFLPSVQKAMASMEQHKTFLKQSDKKWVPLEGFEKNGYISEEPYHHNIIVAQQGPFIMGVYDLKDLAVGKALIAEIRQRLND